LVVTRSHDYFKKIACQVDGRQFFVEAARVELASEKADHVHLQA